MQPEKRNELMILLRRQGYNIFLPVSKGIDLIAHRESDGDLKLIQQRSRWIIARKYVGRNIWIAFPDRGGWYLAPHDEMVSLGKAIGYGKTADYTATWAWTDLGEYHTSSMSHKMREWCEEYQIG